MLGNETLEEVLDQYVQDFVLETGVKISRKDGGLFLCAVNGSEMPKGVEHR